MFGYLPGTITAINRLLRRTLVLQEFLSSLAMFKTIINYFIITQVNPPRSFTEISLSTLPLRGGDSLQLHLVSFTLTSKTPDFYEHLRKSEVLCECIPSLEGQGVGFFTQEKTLTL
jgi:hypothetical protein